MLETKPQLRLVMTLDVPKSFEQLVYFVRDPSKFVTKENISEVGSASSPVGFICSMLVIQEVPLPCRLTTYL